MLSGAVVLLVGIAVVPSAWALAPDAPGQPSVVAGDAQIVVTFAVPTNDGGSPITGYSATCTSSDGGVPGTNTAAASPITVTGLTNGKTYSCSVRATNLTGTGPASSSTNVIVGTPAAPRILRVLPLAVGLALPISPPASNGSPITSYRARCTSTDGGVPRSPLQLVSPIVAANLTPGATYTCQVSANNLRGEGPASASAAVVIGTAAPPSTSCTGSAGRLTSTPGLLLTYAQPQTLALATTFGSCTGTWVTSARLAISVRSSTAITCPSAFNVTNGGSGRITWTAPPGMGTSGVSVRLVVTGTTGHVTKLHFYGEVTSQSNIYTGRRLSGNITINKGLNAVASGGDCTVTLPITTADVTAASLKIT